jgi:hypothetical protein
MRGIDLKTLTYAWEGAGPLAVEVTKPIRQVSIEFEPHGKPMFITLWRPDGSGLRIQSEAHGIAERMEIGVLRFTHLESPSGNEVMLPINPEFNEQIDAFRLFVNESGLKAESGILLRARDGSEITIAAAAFPFMIAINGVVQRPHIFEPERPMEDFERLPIRVGEP